MRTKSESDHNDSELGMTELEVDSIEGNEGVPISNERDAPVEGNKGVLVPVTDKPASSSIVWDHMEPIILPSGKRKCKTLGYTYDSST
ncbi:hypothetical protein LIER_25419 [Lithospermum erythrorhizon]|uniref:Uncharacterized protein n=1 Tax=Lithospermum erythrorhizon TaxID=34254 RepID=A0AAV3RAI5_LITER